LKLSDGILFIILLALLVYIAGGYHHYYFVQAQSEVDDEKESPDDPAINDPGLNIETVFKGIKEITSMAF